MIKSDYKITIIGSGFGGMNMAIQLIKSGITDFIILEKKEGSRMIEYPTYIHWKRNVKKNNNQRL